MIMILALLVPLLAQETEAKKETKKEAIVEQRAGGEMRRGMERRRMVAGRNKMHKKQQIKNIVRLAVVGGLAYYIGYHQGEEHFKGGMKHKPWFGDRK
jgi:hypothetical protein